jgi:hypothetical protein
VDDDNADYDDDIPCNNNVWFRLKKRSYYFTFIYFWMYIFRCVSHLISLPDQSLGILKLKVITTN